jgi:hypothetical protein
VARVIRTTVAIKILPDALAQDPDRLAGSSGKPTCSRRGIIPTSRRFTGLKSMGWKKVMDEYARSGPNSFLTG